MIRTADLLLFRSDWAHGCLFVPLLCEKNAFGVLHRLIDSAVRNCRECGVGAKCLLMEGAPEHPTFGVPTFAGPFLFLALGVAQISPRGFFLIQYTSFKLSAGAISWIKRKGHLLELAQVGGDHWK